MEPITQGLLGAATAYTVSGRDLGRRALFWGALIGMSPDIDVLAGPLHSGFGEWVYHRGTTHSLWFGFVFGPVLGWLLWIRQQRAQEDPPRAENLKTSERVPRQSSLGSWVAVAVVALVTHPLLDGFTPYGTQLLAPFSRTRFVWNGVAIVDPFYSILLGSGVVMAWFAKPAAARWARKIVLRSLLASSAYLAFGVASNQTVVGDLEQTFINLGHPVERVRAYPTILQPWLRHFVIHSGEDRYVGFHSLLRMGCPSWRTRRRPETNGRIEAILATWEGETMRWFADDDLGYEDRRGPHGYITRIDDLRYAWSSSKGFGMWGVEADFDRENRLIGRVRRFSRISPSSTDFEQVENALLGSLPGEEVGWTEPGGCAP